MIHGAVGFWSVIGDAGLGTPTGVTAVRDGIAIDVGWEYAGDDATGFRIYRRYRSVGGSFGSWAILATVTPGTLEEYTDTTPSGSLEYQYRVHAWDGSEEGPGAESGVVGAVDAIEWEDGYPLDVPSNDDEVAYAFDPVVDGNGLQVWARNDFSMGSDPTATGTLVYEGTDHDGVVDAGATNTAVFIRARAVYGSPGSYLYGPWSQERWTFSRPRAPGAPTSVVLAESGTFEVELSWSAGVPNTATVYDLEVAERAAGSSDPWSAWSDEELTPSTDTASPYTWAGVLEGNEYKFRIRARNSTGSSAWVESNVVSFEIDPPDAPGPLVASPAGGFTGYRVSVSWSDNSDNETGFVLQRALDSGGSPGTWSDLVSLGIDVESYLDASAGPPAGTPSIASVTNSEDDSLTVTISGPLPTGATGWELYYIASEEDFQVDDSDIDGVEDSAGASLSITLSGLTPDTVHGLRACYTNGIGRGRPSARSTGTTGPTAPKNLFAFDNGVQHVLTWEIGSRTGDAILVERRIGAGSWVQIASVTAGSTGTIVTRVASSSYRVRFSGEGTYSNVDAP